MTPKRTKEYSVGSDLKQRLGQRGIIVRDLVIYINSSCNLRCKHCYVGNSLLDRSVRLNLESAKNLIDEMSPLDRMTILGGEPFLYKNINEVIARSIRKEIKQRRITTNLTDFFFFDYKRFVGEPLTVAVSIDGHNSATHDEIRGVGSFARTMSNLRTLVNAGYDVEVTHTVTSRSLTSFWSLVQLVKELGVRRLNLHKISMQGNASDHRWLSVKPSEWIGFVSELTKLSTSSPSQADLQIRYPILYTTRDELDALMKTGTYYHHALGSFYSPDRGARIVLYPDQRLYISSELFGTGSYIGRIDNGVFVYNDSLINEREFFSKSPELTIEKLNPVFADEECLFIPISVSYKSNAFA